MIKIVQEEKPINPVIIEPETSVPSSNAYLKSLTIENYDIQFSSTTKNYKIEIDKDVNQLNINAITEDEKATCVITGAEDLQGNNYKVSITVTAENGIELFVIGIILFIFIGWFVYKIRNYKMDKLLDDL